MGIKIRIILLAIWIFILTILIFSDFKVVEAKTIYVDDENNADFVKIQNAIDNASNGDTIRVWAGIYKENITVNKTVTLIGNSSVNTTINAGDNRDVVKITKNFVNMSGFTVTGNQSGEYLWRFGIYISSDYNRIFDNNCSNNDFGIYMRHSNYNQIFNNSCIFNTREGITIYSSVNNHLKNNILDGKGILIEGGALKFWNTHNIESNNKVNGKPVYYYKNTDGLPVPFDAGQVILADCTQMIVENQNCNNIYAGISIGYCSNITIKDNYYKNNHDGIRLIGSNYNWIYNNTIFKNIQGIYLDNSNNNMIFHNNFIDNFDQVYSYRANNTWNLNSSIGGNYWNDWIIPDKNWDGYVDNPRTITGGFNLDNYPFKSINLWDRWDLVHNINKDIYYHTIQVGIDDADIENTIRVFPSIYFENVLINKTITLHGFDKNTTIIDGNMDGHGICITNDFASVLGFKITNCSGCGISLEKANNVNIFENNCSNNYMYGIQIWLSWNCTISNNTCTKNRYGIWSKSSQDNIITFNKCINNFVDGIYLKTSINNTLTNNTCLKNGNNGIWLSHHSNYTAFSFNTCNSNSVHGIYIRWSNYTKIKNNTCLKNYNGLYIEDSKNNSISNNTCSNNQKYGIHLDNCNYPLLKNNTIYENEIGINFKYCQFSNVHFNLINNNSEYGINSTNNDGDAVNATKNWWGHITGPYNFDINIEGIGNNVSNYVNFKPWLTEPFNYTQPFGFIDSISPNPGLDTDVIKFKGHGISYRYIVRYVWYIFPDIELYNGTDNNFTMDSISLGEHIICFKVLDFNGEWSDIISTTLIIHTKPNASIDLISPNSTIESEIVWFYGNGIDDGIIKTYHWNSSIDGFLNNDKSFSLSNLSNGTHTIYFKVKDNYNVWSEEVSTTLMINGIPRARIDEITPRLINEKETVNFYGNVNDDGTIQAYKWQSSIDGFLSSENYFSLSNLSNGTHIISFKAKDDFGIWSDLINENLIINGIPIAKINTISPNPAMENKNVTFVGNYTDFENNITEFHWESDINGFLSNKISFSLFNLSVGNHTITFKIKDNFGVWSNPVIKKLEVKMMKKKTISPKLEIIEITFPNATKENESITINVKIKNIGSIPISYFNVTFYYGNKTIGSVIYNKTLLPTEEALINITWKAILGNHSIRVEIKTIDGKILFIKEADKSMLVNSTKGGGGFFKMIYILPIVIAVVGIVGVIIYRRRSEG